MLPYEKEGEFFAVLEPEDKAGVQVVGVVDKGLF